jgi:hypothetical protein
MVGLILAGTVSQAISSAVELGLPEALAAGPQDLDALAARCGAHRGHLGRLMRALAGFGVFARTGPQTFALTSMGETLLGAEPDGRSLAGMALLAGSPWVADARGALTESIRTGTSAFRSAHGTDLYGCMREHPDLAALWERWTGYSTGVDALAEPILASYDFSSARHVVDVGGRHGALLAQILSATPGLTGTLFDLPDAAARAGAHLRSEGVGDRCRVVGGSFFDGVPDGGDLYVLSNVIEDWDDERAIRILRNCREAMAPGGFVLVIEPVFAEEVLEGPGVSLFDLWMMVVSGGMRTEAELRVLLAAAGLQVRRVIPTASAAATMVEATIA